VLFGYLECDLRENCSVLTEGIIEEMKGSYKLICKCAAK
jgi:hypothetical protein